MVRTGAPSLSLAGLNNLVESNQGLEIMEILLSNASTEEATASAVTDVLKSPNLVHLQPSPFG